jgi:membrane-bound serine protease (ClpP class)
MSMLGWMIVLYIAGIVLLLAEFFVPGGVLGILGGLCVVASGIWASYVYPDQAFGIIVGELIGVLAAILTGVLLITKTGLGRGLILDDSFTQEQGYVSDATDDALLGTSGEVYSPLRPAGSVIIDGRRVSAVANGSYIDKGERVRVIEVRGNRVVVEPVEPMAAPSNEQH